MEIKLMLHIFMPTSSAKFVWDMDGNYEAKDTDTKDPRFLCLFQVFHANASSKWYSKSSVTKEIKKTRNIWSNDQF
jgi:hypothetical protein